MRQSRRSRSRRDADIEIADEARAYVSRAALKLIHALDHFALSPKDRDCLDIGASTGGFTQVLLERGARHVTAIDVGHGQLAESLRDDPRVTLIEGLNARDLTPAHLAEPPQFIVADVSFISLKLALPPALDLAEPGAKLVALIKPQFEAGKEALGKCWHRAGSRHYVKRCATISPLGSNHQGWRVIGMTPSPIAGGDGNREFLIAAEKPC